MKKYFFMLALILFSFVLYAKTITLLSKINENGEISVDNSKGKVEDRIHIENNTDSNITVIIKGLHKKNKILQVATGFVLAHDTKFITTDFEDDLDDFKTFFVSLEKGSIISYSAEMAWSDLYFAVNEINSANESSSAGESAADELLKWKKLLDAGAITQDEFNTKKKQLLSF